MLHSYVTDMAARVTPNIQIPLILMLFVGMHWINYPAGLSSRIVDFSTIQYPAG